LERRNRAESAVDPRGQASLSRDCDQRLREYVRRIYWYVERQEHREGDRPGLGSTSHEYRRAMHPIQVYISEYF